MISKNLKKLRILLISPLPPPSGGIATWTSLFMKSKLAKKHTVHVLNTAIIGKRLKNLEKRYFIDELKRTIEILLQTRHHLRHGYDIVHLNTSCAKFGMIRDVLCIRMAKRKKAKIIVHFHCDTCYMVKGKFSEMLFNKICHDADKLFCLNRTSKKHILRISKKTSMYIPNFLDLEKIPLQQKKMEDPIRNIVFVGNVIKSKGCADIILVAKKMPHLNFKLIGKVSKEMSMIPLPENVVLCGELPKLEVYKQMLSADVLFFPTYTEGFPLVILEAMACGLPIISTPVGAIPDMIEDRGGLIVNVGNIEEFIKAIEHLQNKEIRKQMSTWNLEKVKKHYSLNVVIQQIFREYTSA